MRGVQRAVCGLLSAVCGVFGAADRTAAEVANRIMAEVNDDVITEGDIAVRISGVLQDSDASAMMENRTAEMRRAVLQRLIEERLVLQQAKQQGVRVEPEEVLKRLGQIQERLQTKEAYEQMLRQTGLTEEQLKLKVRDQLLIQKTIEQTIRPKVVVSPAELAQASAPTSPPPRDEELLVYHLLVRVTSDRSAEDAKALIDQLYEQLRHGEDFEELARQHSEGPHAAEGGLLGWVHHGELLPELDEALARLKPGDISDPIPTRIGFHLLKLAERRAVSSPDPPLTDRQQREMQIYQRKFSEALERWFRELKDRAYIHIVGE